MSSHHVIRDEQEPPVFVLDETVNIDLLKQLLGWSPAVWVLEPIAEWTMSLDIKIDGILSKEPEKHQAIEQQSGSYSLSKLKNGGILAAINQIVASKLYTGINIFCNSRQRDEILQCVTDSSLNLPLTLLIDFETIIVIKKQKFRKWYSAGTQLQIMKGELFENDHLIGNNDLRTIKDDGIIQVSSKDSMIIIREI